LLKSARRLPHHAIVGEHVARDRKALAGNGSAPVDALPAGVLADAAGAVDHMHLALLAAFVGRDEALHHLGRRHAVAQHGEALRSVVRIHQRLRREGADATLGVRAERADREEARCDPDAERAGRGVARYDRPSHRRGS
jgi:hypothetical protein